MIDISFEAGDVEASVKVNNTMVNTVEPDKVEVDRISQKPFNSLGLPREVRKKVY